MEAILSWGAAANIWLQNFSPALDAPFKIITFCGEELFFMALLPLVYWSVNRTAGVRLLILFLFSAWVNSAVKTLACDARPYQYDSRVKAIQHVSSWGFPSGHTQLSVTVWGYMAEAFRKKWLTVLAAAMMILVPLSRLYLGVHDPPDLIGGYLIGFILLIAFIKIESRCASWLEMRSIATLLGIAIIAPAVLLALSPGLDQDGVTAASTLMGFAAGFVFESRYLNFSSGGPMLKKILRYALGLTVIIGLWAGLKWAFRDFEPAMVFRFVRYALIGVWVSLGAPWLFVALRLADRNQEGR
ncbi:MAG: phosphatase PAP2 family protein [Deltaproteobacteria bacterium]|nr:phosphatase PAP2 family protein [Deltaproteobacteria bacterium]